MGDVVATFTLDLPTVDVPVHPVDVTVHVPQPTPVTVDAPGPVQVDVTASAEPTVAVTVEVLP